MFMKFLAIIFKGKSTNNVLRWPKITVEFWCNNLLKSTAIAIQS